MNIWKRLQNVRRLSAIDLVKALWLAFVNFIWKNTLEKHYGFWLYLEARSNAAENGGENQEVLHERLVELRIKKGQQLSTILNNLRI